MIVPEVEPTVAVWDVVAFGVLVARLRDGASRSDHRPIVIAVDGRSGSGKTTFAARLGSHVTDSVVVHTDDLAWWESFFGWDHLLVEGILRPVSLGRTVSFRPPAWTQRGRAGAIDVPASVSMLVIEGVGASRRRFDPWLRASIWMQSDLGEAYRRGLARDGGTPEAQAFWDEWNRQEVQFLADDRPWERAQYVVCGTPAVTGVAHDPQTEILIARTSIR